MLLQAYDFYHLNKEHNCSLQLGGSDQWGNIVGGVDLIHKISRKDSFGLTTPLLTTSSGAKMGKSVSGAIWINEEELSPYDYFQYWRNTEDADVVRFAKLYCEFDDNQLAEFENLTKNQINEAKKQLAYRVTELCHGQEKADNALETAVKTFEQGIVSDNLPTIFVKEADLKNGIACVDLMQLASLVASKGEGRRLIKGNGVRVNEERVTDENLVIDSSFLKDDLIKLSAGKKQHALVKVEK